MTSTSVGMRCPECAGERTRARTVSSVGASSDQPWLTYFLIALNVLVFVGGYFSGASATGSGGVGGASLLADGSVSRPAVADGEWWRVLSAGFLHAGFFHLLFNMFALYVLGSLLEPAIGRLRFGALYFVSLLAGSFGALLLEPTAPTVGASGAIFGLMGAAVVVMRNRGISPMESGLGLWIGLNLLITFAIPGISIGGHIGGLIGGVLAALLVFEVSERVRMNSFIELLAVSLLGVAAVVGCVAIASS